MRPLAFVALLVSIHVLSAQSVFACGGPCRFWWNAVPRTSAAPVTVVVQGETENLAGMLKVDMGGEGVLNPTWEPYFDGSPCYGDAFRSEHRFFCPGTYTIRVINIANPNEVNTTTITALPPPDFHLLVFAGDSDRDAYLVTHVSSSQRPFLYSTVDWGDGTSEKFTYELRGLYAGTPTHTYAADGEYTATLKHHYEGEYCSWDQAETILVKVPTVTTGTNPSTWGYVKSMYR